MLHAVRGVAVVMAAVSTTWGPPAGAAEPADLVLRHGHIYRVPERGSAWAQAVAVRDGRYVAIGSDADMRPYIGPATQVVDLQGRMAMPGLADAHIHPIDGAYEALYSCTLPPEGGLPEVLAAVKACADRAAPDDWIVGAAYSSSVAPALEKREALRLLDDVSGGRPVVLRDDTFHNRWVNSEVLRRAGIRAGATPPPGGLYVFDQGEPTGLLKEFPAFDKVQQLLPPRRPDRLLQAAQTAAAQLSAKGVTSIQDAWVDRTLLHTWHRALQSPQGLPLRVVTSLAGAKGSTEAEPGGGALYDGAQALRGPQLRPDFVKFFVDGVPMAYTSAMLDPYQPSHEHGHDFRGQAHYSLPQLVEAIAPLDQRGIAVKLHAVGDAAVRLSLDAIAEVRRLNGSAGPRHQIAHVNWIAPSDLPRFKALNVTAEVSPMLWFPTSMTPVLAHFLGAPRTDRLGQVASLQRAGAPLAVGSDWPAGTPTPDPWIGIQGLVTRRDPLGLLPGVLGAGEQLSLADALRLYTRGNAVAMGLGHDTGSVELGKSADLIVLDQHLFKVPVERIHRTRVLGTWLQGRLVFQQPAQAKEAP